MILFFTEIFNAKTFTYQKWSAQLIYQRYFWMQESKSLVDNFGKFRIFACMIQFLNA